MKAFPGLSAMKKDFVKQDKKRLIDIHELSDMIGICESTLYSWAKSRKIGGVYKFGRCIRFDYDSVLLWISEHEMKGDSDNGLDD